MYLYLNIDPLNGLLDNDHDRSNECFRRQDSITYTLIMRAGESL